MFSQQFRPRPTLKFAGLEDLDLSCLGAALDVLLLVRAVIAEEAALKLLVREFGAGVMARLPHVPLEPAGIACSRRRVRRRARGVGLGAVVDFALGPVLGEVRRGERMDDLERGGDGGVDPRGVLGLVGRTVGELELGQVAQGEDRRCGHGCSRRAMWKSAAGRTGRSDRWGSGERVVVCTGVEL